VKGPTPGKKVFAVTITRTDSCDMYIEGESREEVEKAVEDDDLENYFYDTEYDVSVHEIPLDKLSQKAVVEHGVLNGEVHEIDDEEYQQSLIPEENRPPPPDTVTLPLFPAEKEKR
jgi:hypothetical protein